ncbi:hypothetical protein [Pseudarthrobacter sp. ATCC 49987]|uniref:hypothetical protein n=1 Tax=Pseudarthrobacter sp. ATCC 49987 TaxID=2698204 RepID=UPI00136C3986|nr:hypothetical protein [Pseudarthrobacter sp. ATCC 49987]
MDPQIVELVKALTAPFVAAGGVTGWYLLYRKFDAERAASLRADIATANAERDTARKELRDERTEHKTTREELRTAEETIDQLRAKLRGDVV